jgi:hypothetical protein
MGRRRSEKKKARKLDEGAVCRLNAVDFPDRIGRTDAGTVRSRTSQKEVIE